MEIGPSRMQQQTKGQSETSAELIKEISAEFNTFIDASSGSKISDESKLSSEKLLEIFTKFAKLPKDLAESSSHEKLQEIEFLVSDSSEDLKNQRTFFKNQLLNFIYHNWKMRLSLTKAIKHYLEAVASASSKSGFNEAGFEEDCSGYYIANLILFAETLDKIIDTQHKATVDLQSSYKAVVANGAYPPRVRSKLQSLAQIYLYKYHTTCFGCQRDSGVAPVVGKSILQGVPFCLECFKKEELAFSVVSKAPPPPKENE